MRVRISSLAPGTTYYVVFSATGTFIGRYTTEAEAQRQVAKDPERRSYLIGTKR